MIWLTWFALAVAALALWGAVSEIRRGLSRDHRMTQLDDRLRHLEIAAKRRTR